jgi:uncharacterized protein involved in exopolysaccharide biosynthesis
MQSAADNGLSLWTLLQIFSQRRRLLLAGPVVFATVAIVTALFLPNWFTATARILPPQQSQSNAIAILGQLGSLGSVASQSFGVRSPSDVYVAILKSRTIADAVITKFDLAKTYREDTLVETRKALGKHVIIGAGRDGVIAIEVEDRDPQRAADIANAFVNELGKLTINLAITEASQRRLFFENQLTKAKTDLADAEHVLKIFSVKAGLVNPQGQLGVTVATAASLRGQIAAKEIQLSAMRSFATEQNPDFERTRQELVGLRSELAKIEQKTGSRNPDVLLSFAKAPELGLEYAQKLRNVRYYEALFEVLAKQYEIARIDEAKDATLVQTLDVAIAPDKRSGPARGLIIIVATLLGAFFSVVTVLVLETKKAVRAPVAPI